MTDQLLPVILSLDASARSIDETFATAGSRLGEALSVFATTHLRLGAVSDELSANSGMDRMREGMLEVAGDLRAFSAGLSIEARCLQAIAEQGQVAAKSFRHLGERVGFVTAVTRSARTESAWLRTTQDGPGFFDTIGNLVGLARQSVDDCVAGHARLKALLTSAISTQTDFASTYGTQLATLADELESSLGRIEDSQHQGTRLAFDAALKSRTIADSTSAAIVALQCGDSTRQRLEHTLATLRWARAGSAGTCAIMSGLAEPDRALLLRVLHDLVAVQLRDTTATMRHDIDEIDTTLRLLGEGMAASQDGGRALDSDPDQNSPLAAFEADLGLASGLLAKCNAAREQVDRLTDALTACVDQLRQTSHSLSRTVSNIVLLGMNARLHASRVGTEGRVLVVIAQEMKSAADEIVEDAAQLSPTFASMHELVASMQARKAGGSDRLASLDSTMRRLLAVMKHKRVELVATLEQLAADSSTYAVQVADARQAFAAAGAVAAAVDASAAVVDDHPAALPSAGPPIDAPAIEALLDEEVFQHYTMSTERKLHAATAASHGLKSRHPQAAEEPSANDLDAIFAF